MAERAEAKPAQPPPEGGRERLLDAAIALISEQGYAATSVGQVCARAGVPTGVTDPESPVERVIHAPALAFPRGDAALKGMGFTKLVRRDDGVYENVTAAGGEPKLVSSDDPGSISRLVLLVTFQ